MNDPGGKAFIPATCAPLGGILRVITASNRTHKGELMSRLWLGAAILLLSSAWMFAQPGTAPADRYPTSNPPARTIEGCLSSLDDDFVLTDANGKRYQLTGDVAQLTARVGHKVRVSGHVDNVRDAELMVAAGPFGAVSVHDIKSLSAGCR